VHGWQPRVCVSNHVPSVQSVHEKAPVWLFVLLPIAHAKQLDSPVWFANVPESQSWHSRLPLELAKVPFAQAEHVNASCSADAVPRGHFRH
jgi:hypothetical protein